MTQPTQGSADPPVHVDEGELETDNETQLRLRERNGQTPPASNVGQEMKVGRDPQRR